MDNQKILIHFRLESFREEGENEFIQLKLSRHAEKAELCFSLKLRAPNKQWALMRRTPLVLTHTFTKRAFCFFGAFL